MSQTAVIHARIDPATKEATERILETLGLTPTEAIRLLYRQIAIRGEFPLELKVPNAETSKALSDADSGIEVESFDNTHDLYASWES
jgi:DNA-damage-inducible protein J